MSAKINKSSVGCDYSGYQEVPVQNFSASRKIYGAVKDWVPFLAYCGIAYASVETAAKIGHYYHENCSCLTESLACGLAQCAAVSATVLVVMAVGKAALIGLGYGGWASSSPIRNPSVIPSAPPQAQPNAFFQPQQNGGPARYAEDDLQGTHWRPLGNYDPVQWNGGSQSI